MIQRCRCTPNKMIKQKSILGSYKVIFQSVMVLVMFQCISVVYYMLSYCNLSKKIETWIQILTFYAKSIIIQSSLLVL